MPRRIALVTSRSPGDDAGEVAALVADLAAVGVTAEPIGWDADVDWSAFDGVVVRAAHDYMNARDEFVDWVERTSAVTPLANPADLLRWNTDKRYLRDLAEAGVPTVPTAWAEPDGPALELPDSWAEIVVKPSVGVGGIGASRFSPDRRADALARVEAIVASGVAAMVQPFVDGVEGTGETGTYFLGGEPSHAIRKMGQLRPDAAPFSGIDDVVFPDVTAAPLDAVLVAFARDVLAAAPVPAADVLYARVDTVPTAEGPALIELEVAEPFLYLFLEPAAGPRFASAVVAWLASRSGV